MKTGKAYIKGCNVKFSEGVYAWFFYVRRNCFFGNRKCLYVGKSEISALSRAGGYRESPSVSTNDSRDRLDTDFIVKTCIDYLLENGINCYCQHVNNYPNEELEIAKEYRPIIQRLKESEPKLYFRLKVKREENYWRLKGMDRCRKKSKTDEARKEVRRIFKKILTRKKIYIPE